MNNDYKPFSERYGYAQPKSIQREDIDEDLRNGLWNLFLQSFPKNHSSLSGYYAHGIFESIWSRFEKKPADEYSSVIGDEFAKRIILKEQWTRVFELIEFVIGTFALRGIASRRDKHIFIAQCNRILKQENSAYRVIQGLVTEITSEQEIESLETAMTTPHKGARTHIEKAFSLFSRRENPDYHNSIKESISAVESIINEVTGETKFAAGVELLEKHGITLHGAHKAALKNLYGFTSDADSIRHGSKGEQLNINQNTARLMLITCSAFVNYITVEAPKRESKL